LKCTAGGGLIMKYAAFKQYTIETTILVTIASSEVLVCCTCPSGHSLPASAF
jgi:hypothetical protein